MSVGKHSQHDRPFGGEPRHGVRAAGRRPGASSLLKRPRPIVIAHRGASDTAPENSLLAFGRALDEGADALETDLRIAADGTIVCHHDPSTGRVADRDLDIGRSTLAALRAADLLGADGRPSGEVIPTLEELLELTPADVVVVLELKDPRMAIEPGVGRLRALLGDRVQLGTAVVVSFSLARVVAARQAVPGLAIGHITVGNPLPLQPGDLVGPYWPLLRINPWYVAMAHRLGKLVCPLDPQLPRRLDRYLALGVDGVLTETPAITRRAIDRLRVI